MEPGSTPKVLDIENKLSVLQHYVGGYIETCYLSADCCVICDEDGKCKELPVTFTYGDSYPVEFVGPLLISGWNGVDFTDIPEPFINIFCSGA